MGRGDEMADEASENVPPRPLGEEIVASPS